MKTKIDYLKNLEEGHKTLTEEYAKEVCEVFNVPFNKKLSKKQGVRNLDLLYYLAKKLNIDAKNDFNGYGFQAEFVANGIKKVINNNE